MLYRVGLVALLLCLFQTAAAAQDVADIPPGEDRIVPLRQGESAPYTGQLYDQPTALRWGNWLMQYKFRLEADVERERQVCDVELRYRDQLLRIEKARAQKAEKELFSRLARSEKARLTAEEAARNPVWYKGRDFGIVLGVAGTVSAVALSIWALEARN